MTQILNGDGLITNHTERTIDDIKRDSYSHASTNVEIGADESIIVDYKSLDELIKTYIGKDDDILQCADSIRVFLRGRGKII